MLLIVTAMSVSAYFGTALAQVKEEGRPVLAPEAARLLVGNTLVYAKEDQSGEEMEMGVYLRLDGSGLAASRKADGAREPRHIRWATLSDGQFCVSDVGRKPSDGDCGILSIDGATAALTPRSGRAWSGKVLEGDAWKLDGATLAEVKFVGRAATKALIGNTLVFIPYGGGREYMAYYFLANGRMRRAHNDQPYFDHWVLQPDETWSVRGKDEHLCFSGGMWGEDYCVGVAVAGNLVTLWTKNAGPVHGELRKGDARNLSPAASTAIKKMGDALAGNTLLLRASDRQATTDSIIYFQRNGFGRAKWGGEAPRPIKWLIQLDGKLCLVEQRLKFRDQNCATLSIDGDAVTFATPDRPAIPGRILRGDALKM